MNWHIVVFLFLLALFPLTYLADYIHPDYPIYMCRTIYSAWQENEPTLIYLLGSFAYGLIGKAAFVMLPFIFYFIAIIFLMGIFARFKIPILILPILLTFNYKVIQVITSYNRDTIFFALACMFSFYWLIGIYEKKRVWPLLAVLLVLMLFTKIFVLVFIVLFVALLLRGKKGNLFIGMMVYDWLNRIKLSFNAERLRFLFSGATVRLFLTVPVVLFSAVLLLFKPDRWHAFVLLITLLFIFGTLAPAVDIGVVMRNAFMLLPLHFFYVGRILCR